MDTSERRVLHKRISGISDQLKARFKNMLPIAHLFIKAIDHHTFYCNLFLETELQMQEAGAAGLQDDLKEYLLDCLDVAGIGPRDALRVQIVVRSREEIDRDFSGDFYRAMY